MTINQGSDQPAQGLVGWRVVAVASGVYFLALIAYYLLLLPHWSLSILHAWPLVDLLLVGVAAFIAYGDIVALRRARRLRRGDVLAISVVAVLVILWIVGLFLLPILPDGRFDLLRVFIVAPFVPLMVLARLGSLARRSAMRASVDSDS